MGNLGEDIDVVVMQGAPTLLSIGQLVRQGHTLQWEPGGCTLRTPAGRVIDLHVVNGIPMLPGRGQTERRPGTGEGATAHVGAVRDGFAEANQKKKRGVIPGATTAPCAKTPPCAKQSTRGGSTTLEC